MLEGSNGTNVGADQGSESKSLAVNQIVALRCDMGQTRPDPHPFNGLRDKILLTQTRPGSGFVGVGRVWVWVGLITGLTRVITLDYLNK